ncbi:MAG: dipeptide ABC transporter ATP-binding protein [Betaproteobacteria bacterium]
MSTAVLGGAGVALAVDHVSFDIAAGETFALVGESGCGKSLTALSVTRLLPQGVAMTGGQILFEGHDLASLPERSMRDYRGRRMAMIFQEPATSLNPVIPVGAQVAEALQRHLGLRGGAATRRVLELFDAVGIPDPLRRLGEYPFQLSGGMRQRVMIAMAIACEPDLLVADEPTTALDVTIQAQVLALLSDLQRRTGMAMLLITHDFAVVAQMASQVAVMYAGQIVEARDADRFFEAPLHPYARQLVGALPVPGKAGQRLANIAGVVPPLGTRLPGCRFEPRCDVPDPQCAGQAPALVGTGDGCLVRCLRHGAEPLVSPAPIPCLATPLVQTRLSSTADERSDPVLEVTGLKVHFPIRRGILRRTVGHVRAVDGVDLRIGRGRTLALVGESGCGKTTVGKAIVRLLDPAAGRISFDGTDLAQLEDDELIPFRKGFQIVFQDPFSSLDPRMRVRDILAEGVVAMEPSCRGNLLESRMTGLLVQVGLPADCGNRYPHEFSGGQRQRIAIARALAARPRLLVCDEPTSALDVSVQAQILNLLGDLQNQLGLSYLFITHNISVVAHLAHEVAVMYLGRIVEHGRVDEVLAAPRHPYTKALLASVPTLARGSGNMAPVLGGDMPSPAQPPAGCHFSPRCPDVQAECRLSYPKVTGLSATHRVACHLVK